MSTDSETETEIKTADTGSHEFRRLGSGGVLNLGSAFVAQLLTFGAIALIGHAFGATAVGMYSEAFAVRALMSLLCLGGMRNAMTRYVAAYRAVGDAGAARGTVRIGLWSSIALSAIATLVLVLVTPALARDAFGEPALQRGLLFASWSLVPATMTVVALSATQGFQTMRAYAVIGSILDAGIRLGFVIAGAFAASLDLCLFGLLASSVVTMIAALVALGRLLRRMEHAPRRYHYREIVRYSLYSWLSSVANQGLLWADTVILGLYLSSRQVGVYQVATRAVLLATLAVVPLTASFAPLAADLWQRQAVGPLRRIYTATSEWLVRISFPGLLVVAVFASTMLSIFGSGFSGGVIVIQIFVVGSIIDVWASASGVTLNMSGFNRLNMFDTVGVLILNVGLNILLIPHLGIVGSVWAWTIALAAYGAVRVVQVDRLVLGGLPISTRTRQSLIAAVPATIAALTARVVLGDTFVGLFVGGAASLGLYVLTLWHFGFNEDDRLLFAGLEGLRGMRSTRGMRRREEPRVALGTSRRSDATEWRRTLNASLRITAYRVVPTFRRPPEPVPLHRLISPLRADILVRADFFDYLDDTVATGPIDLAAITEGAKDLAYHTWFTSVAVSHIGISSDGLDDAFATRVRRSVKLWQQYRTYGFDPRRPILLTWSDAVRTTTGKELGPQYQPLDGCHRIALLWRAGVRALQPHECWYRESRTLAIDNTAALLGRLQYDERGYAWYLSLGLFDEPVTDLLGLDDLVMRVRASRGVEAAARAERIIAIDRAAQLDKV